MALISSSEGLVQVEYGQFFVTAGTSDREVGPTYSGTEDFLEVGEGAVLCISAWSTHHAAVRLEFWSGEPDQDAGWELAQAVRLRRGEGAAAVNGLMGRTACELDLPVETGSAVELAVACRGRVEVREQAAAQDSPVTGVETWRFQFWGSDLPPAG